MNKTRRRFAKCRKRRDRRLSRAIQRLFGDRIASGVYVRATSFAAVDCWVVNFPSVSVQYTFATE